MCGTQAIQYLRTSRRAPPKPERITCFPRTSPIPVSYTHLEARDDHLDHGTARHERDEIGEERLVGEVGVVDLDGLVVEHAPVSYTHLKPSMGDAMSSLLKKVG